MPGYRQSHVAWLAAFALLLLLVSLVTWLLPGTTVTMQVQGVGSYQVYYDVGDGFNESDSTVFNVDDPAFKEVTIAGLPLGLRALRIDPPSRAGRISLCRVTKQVNDMSGADAQDGVSATLAPGPEVAPQGATSAGCGRWLVGNGATDPQVHAHFGVSSTEQAHARKLSIASWVLLVAFILGMATAIRLLTPESVRLLESAADRGYSWLDRRLVIVFLLLGSTLGAGYAFLSPPGSIPDEIAHAGKIARISIGDWVGDDHPGPYPPVMAWYGNQTGGRQHPRTSASELRALAATELECDPTSPENPDAAANAGPMQYVAPSLGYQATCASGAGFGAFLYGSRILNLLLYLGLVGWGLAHAGFGRWPLFAVALLPMSLYLASSISYDAPMLAATFCLLGFASGIYSRQVSCRAAIIPVIVVSLFLALQKPQAGWVFVLPAIALARCVEQGYPRLKWAALTILLPLCVHLAWVVSSLANAGDRPDVAAVNGIQSMVEDPLRFMSVFIDTYSSSTGIFVAKGVVGILGWLDVYLDPLGYAACAAALLAAVSVGGRGASPSWGAAAFIAGAALGAFVLSNVPFYAFWTEPQASLIQGLQGRYFLTMVAAVLMVLPTLTLRFWRPIGAVAVIALLLGASLFAYDALLLRYF